MLLLFIYLGFIYSKSVDVYLYTSERKQEGLGFRGGEFTVTHDPIMLTVERINNSYFLKAANNNYLTLDNEHLIASLKKSSWILRKNKNLSDKSGVSHYQLENNSKCLVKAHGKLKADKCDVTSESQMLFFVTPSNGADKKEINKFFDAAIDAEIQVVDKTIRLHPEQEEGEFYQIMIKKSVETVTKTVQLQEVPRYIEKQSLRSKAKQAAKLASKRSQLEREAKARQRRSDNDKPRRRVRRRAGPQRGRQGNMPQGDESSDSGFGSDDQSQSESDDGSKRNRPGQTPGRGAGGKGGRGKNSDEDSGSTGQGQGQGKGDGQGKGGQGKRKGGQGKRKGGRGKNSDEDSGSTGQGQGQGKGDGQGKGGQGKRKGGQGQGRDGQGQGRDGQGQGGQGQGGQGQGRDGQGQGGQGGKGGRGGRNGPEADYSSDGKDGYSAPSKASGAVSNPKANGYLNPDEQGSSSDDLSDSGSRGGPSGKRGIEKNSPLAGTGIESVPGLIDDILDNSSSKKSKDEIDMAFKSLKDAAGRSAGVKNSVSGGGANAGVKYEPRVQVKASASVPGKDVKKLNMNFGGGLSQKIDLQTTTNIVPVMAYNNSYSYGNNNSGQQGNPPTNGNSF